MQKVNDMQCKGTKSKASLSVTKSLICLPQNSLSIVVDSYRVARKPSGIDKLLDGFVDGT